MRMMGARSADPHQHYAARLRYLAGLLRGIENLDEAASIIGSAANEDDALDRLAAALDLSADQCRPIIDMRLGQLLPGNVEMLRREMADLREHLGDG